MMDILANTIEHADTILLLLKGGRGKRFSASLQTMLKRMTIMFGKDWWDHVLIGVSFWTYDEASIRRRKCYPNYTCKNEAWFEQQINTQMCEKLHVCEKNFTFVFADSWSQTPDYNTDDQLQQDHWQTETGKLWEVTTTRAQRFDFQTIDDILEENARHKREIQQLNDVISTDIAQLNQKVNNIISTDIAQLNQQLNNVIDNDIAQLNLVPLGTITAWVTKPTMETRQTVDLPDGWVRCDGGTILEPSIWAGQFTPNLNHEKRFLRGAPDSEVLTMEEDQMQDHKHDFSDPGHTHRYDDKYPNYWGNDKGVWGPPASDKIFDRYDKSHTSQTVSSLTGMTVKGVSSGYNFGSETRPKNMNVIFIMRVW